MRVSVWFRKKKNSCWKSVWKDLWYTSHPSFPISEKNDKVHCVLVILCKDSQLTLLTITFNSKKKKKKKGVEASFSLFSYQFNNDWIKSFGRDVEFSVTYSNKTNGQEYPSLLRREKTFLFKNIPIQKSIQDVQKA